MTLQFYVKRFLCICCEGREEFNDCPLCDDERIFEEDCFGEIDNFMVQFYDETVLDSDWNERSDQEKFDMLNEELETYRQSE